MKQLKILLISIVLIVSCQQQKIEYHDIDSLMEVIKNDNNLSVYPDLLIDGYDYNYALLKGKLVLKKKDIGFYEFVKTQTHDNGLLRIITHLPKINYSDYYQYHIELNDERINHQEFKKIKLKDIIKKAVITNKKLNDSLYNGVKSAFIIYTK